MMHEEFEKLTGLIVSYRYYAKYIESEYADGTIDKETFCSQWVKAHKGDICKASAVDMDGLIRDAAHVDMVRADADEQRQLKCVVEAELAGYKKSYAEQTAVIESMKDRNERLSRDIEVLKDENNELAASEHRINELKDVHEKALDEKDMEIMKLKSMLFDLMYRTA